MWLGIQKQKREKSVKSKRITKSSTVEGNKEKKVVDLPIFLKEFDALFRKKRFRDATENA